MVWTKFWKLALAYDGFWGKDALKVKFSQICLNPPLLCFVLGGLVVFCYQSFAEYVYRIYLRRMIKVLSAGGMNSNTIFWKQKLWQWSGACSTNPEFQWWAHFWRKLRLKSSIPPQYAGWYTVVPSWTISQSYGRRINVNQGLNQPHWATILHFWMACGVCVSKNIKYMYIFVLQITLPHISSTTHIDDVKNPGKVGTEKWAWKVKNYRFRTANTLVAHCSCLIKWKHTICIDIYIYI